MKILIIGAGAIGGSLACYLSAGGHDITLLEKNKDICDAINRDGVFLKDQGRDYHARVLAVDKLGEEKYDCCFSATRAYHMTSAVSSVLSNIVDGGPIVSMNNGVCIEPLLEVVDKERAFWCSINYGAGIEDKGRYYIKIHGDVVIGGLSGKGDKLSDFLAKLTTPLLIRPTDNIVGALYSKMLINSCITSTAVVSGLTLGDILSKREGKKVFLSIIREGVEVAKEAGIEIPKYNGNLDYYRFSSKSIVGCIYRAVVFPVLRKKYGHRTSATLEALRRGTLTEIDYFNGYVLSLARKSGRSAPVNEAVVKCVKCVENDMEKISADRLYELSRVK